MFKFLFIIFLLFVLFVFLFGFSILRLLFGGLFGVKPKQSQSRNTQTRQNKPTKTSGSQKIIASDEGEYIEYEEIKD